MLSDQDAKQNPADWYLIASGGDLVLRLVQDLQIGEDGSGGIVLSPTPEKALLRVTTRDRELTLQALALHWTFCQNGGSTRQHLTFPAGTSVKLNFPTCSLVITPKFLEGQRVRPDCVVDLRPTAPPALALRRLSEPVTLVDHPAVTLPTLPPIGVATTEEIAALLEATSEDDGTQFLEGDHDVPDETPVAIPILEEQVFTATPIRAPVLPPASESLAPDSAAASSRPDTAERRAVSRRPVSPRAMAAAGIAAVLLIVPMAFLLEHPEKLGVHFLRSNYLPAGQMADPFWPEDAPSSIAATRQVPVIDPTATVEAPPMAPPPENAVAESRPFEEPLPLADRQPAGTSPAPMTTSHSRARRPLTEQEAARVAVLVAEAQALFDSGNIVTPVHDNAVGRLIEVLTLDPTNEAGLRLMYQSAVRLVEEAEAAHEAGDDYLARNLLEDVLGFHPDFEMARQLQKDWNVEGNG